MTAPKLRFKAFDGDWSNKSLDQISKVFDGTHQTPTYVDSGVKFVSVENINAPYESDKFITEEAFKKDFKNQPRLNDILMTRITAGEIGATAIVNDSEPLAYYVSLALIRPKAEVNTPYLNQYIATPQFKKELHKRIIHVAFPKKINLGDINECLVAIPNEEEQTKIASFLSQVDEKISQLTQKHELLSQYKQGMMQKLFSQKIRFKADDGSEFGEWEEKKLGKICSHFQSGKTITSVSITEVGEYPVFGGNGLRGYTNTYTHDGIFALIGRQGALCGNINLVNGKTFISEHAIAVQANLDSSTEWLSIWLDYMQLNRFSESSAQAGLAVNKLVKFDIAVPCLEEQTKIANFLSAIDQKIEVVAQQIEQAKTWKKGLLQQMFV